MRYVRRQRLRYDIALTMLVWLALGCIKLSSYWQWLFFGEAVPIGDCFKFALASVCQVQRARVCCSCCAVLVQCCAVQG